MKPFQNTALLRPLTIEELRLEDPEWVDDHTITFYIPCWFHVDSVFAGIHVETDQNVTTSTSTAFTTPGYRASVCP